MDKRSWPWRKKPSDKGLTSNESGGSSPLQSLKHFDDQVMSGLRLDNIRISDATMLQHQADEKIRHLNERLLAADDLVKQHVKVAEEAVSGWEKAKAEYVSVKHQLDTVVEQKRATEDRVFHLDGALKECMQQLRQTREEQEQKLHEVIIRKTRDWEKLRLEFEERLAHANQQLVEVGHQKNHLYKTVQEQAEAVAELGQARSQAEAEVQMLQVRVETFEKENASLKYEVTILNKELEIRNQEKEINKRSADLASRQHLEGIKKIAKLEAECQRLRGLVRKKLPGPGALVQMKLEVEGLDAEKGEFSNKWRSGGKAVSSPKAAHGESILKSESVLSERLLTMEEETKMLKEALAKRNSELHTARLMCARTADKLSTLEGQVGHFQKSPRIPLIGHGPHVAEASISLSVSKEPSQASMSEDGNDDERSVADSWASALVTELAYFQKEKATQQQSNKLQQSHKLHEQLDSIVDFIEIERLVSLPLEKQGSELNTKAEPSPPSISEQVLAKEAELQAANKLCAEVNNKLVAAEAQLSLLRSKNAANELNLFSLQQKLSMILEGNERGDPEKVLEDVKNAVLASRCSSVDGLQAHVMKLSKVSSPGHSSETPSSLEISPHQQESSPSKCGVGDKIFKIGPEITSGVCKLVRLVEDLASEGMAQHLATTCPEECRHNGVDSDGSPCNIHSTSKSRPLELDTSIRNFITASNQFLHGKVELVQFIADLSFALSQIRKLDSPAVFSSLASRVKKRPEALQDAEQEVFSDAGSPVSRTSNSDGSEQLAAKVLPADGRVLNSRGLHTDEDLRKVQAEKAALESHMRAEFSRMATVEQMFAQLKQEKIELENTMEEEKEKLETMKGQLLDAEQLVASLRVRLASTELSRNLADEHLSSITAVKAKLESQLEDSQLELIQMHEKLKSFKKSIDLEHARNEELQAKVDELQKILWKPSSSSLQSGANLDAEKSIKEQEIVDATEKLAECQRTILVLGKQLKDIASARDPPLISFNPPADQVQKPSQKDEPAKNANINSTLQKVKQRVSSDPGDCSISDVTDHEISSAVKGGGRGSGKKMSDLLGDKLLAHEGNIQAVSHMPSSPDAEADTQLAKYVPKPALKKKSSHPFAAIDLSKSLNLDPSSSPRKHGTSFSRFFSRHKNAI